ncbi:hypothetical protein ACLMJK_003331 [Lecanora helva]
MESVKRMHEQVGELCFSTDGIARSGILVRHLVMPGKQDEGQEIMRWLANNVSKDIFVDIMEQYRSAAHVGKPGRSSTADRTPRQTMESVMDEQDEWRSSLRYHEINRSVTSHEILSVRKAAEQAGLWRFCDPVRHEGLNG